MLKTLPNDSKVQKILYNPKYAIICAVGNAPFHGTIEIEYQPEEILLEFESFEKWLFSISNTRETIESLCRIIFDNLTLALGEVKLTVKVCAETQVHSPASALIQR